MHNRGGFPVKNVIYAVFLLAILYMVYIYNNSQNRLRDAEMTGARYKREVEERVTEIQDVVRAKDKIQESCQNEKAELNNRIKSINQQNSMVQSHLKETDADFSKLKQDVEQMHLDRSRAEEVWKLDFQRMKQDKDNEIAKLRDGIADLTRRSGNMDIFVQRLKEQLTSSEAQLQNIRNHYVTLGQSYYALQAVQKKLADENAQLKLLQGQPQQQQQQQQPHLPNSQLLFNQNLSNHIYGEDHNFVNNMKIDDLLKNTNEGLLEIKRFEPERFTNVGQDKENHYGDANQNQQQNGLAKRDGLVNTDRLAKELEDVKPLVDELQQQRQVAAPNNQENNDNMEDDRKDVIDDEGNDRPGVNPNDEQKAQILEPNLDGHDKHQGGGEVGVIRMSARDEEEARERGLREDEVDEDDDLIQHKNPLALNQIEQPNGLNDLRPGGKKEDDSNLAQQMPPLLRRENDQNLQENADRHYFGEEEEANRQRLEEEADRQGIEEGQQQQPRQQLQDEEGREEGNEAELDNNNPFQDDAGRNSVNKAINPVPPL